MARPRRMPRPRWMTFLLRGPAAMVVALGSMTGLPTSAQEMDGAAGREAGQGPLDSIPDSAWTRGAGWAGLPFLFYTPETGLGGGALAAHYARLGTAAEISSFPAAATITGRGQFVLELFPDVYLSRGERLSGEVRISHYPDVFYGVGPDTPEEREEEYTARVADVWARAQLPLGRALRAGVQARFRHEDIVEVEESGLLADGSILGSDGGTAVALGVVGTWDTRDNIFSPRGGRYVEASWLVHNELLGSDFDFHRVVLDARQYLPVGEASTLAFQGCVEAAPGQAPFSLLPLLGGAERMRGYRLGRFRDRVSVVGQGEFRFPVWRRFGGATFVSAGDVAPHLGDLSLSSLEVAGGAGLRFRFTDEGVTLRGDFAWGREGGGVYLTLGHAF